jgi:FAD/FMN-containing dehydrogenase
MGATPTHPEENAMLAILTLDTPRETPAPQRIPILRVRSADELRGAMRQSRQSALAVDASGMDRVLRVDAGRGLLEVQAGTNWTLLAAYLAQRGIALQAFAALRELPRSVGEAVQQAAAGPDGLPVCAHVASLTLVMPDGELRRAGRDSSPELFGLALGGQGVTGVLYSVTLNIESLQASARQARDAVELCISDAAAAGTVACEIECLLPPEELAAFLAEMRAAAHEHRIALHGITVRHTLPDRDSFLRWATRDWAGVQVRFGVKPTLGAGVRAAEIRRLLLDMALAHGGSLPIRDPRYATRRQLETCYPMLGTFLAEKKRADPAGRLQNAWYREIVAKLRSEICETRWDRPRA